MKANVNLAKEFVEVGNMKVKGKIVGSLKFNLKFIPKGSIEYEAGLMELILAGVIVVPMVVTLVTSEAVAGLTLVTSEAVAGLVPTSMRLISRGLKLKTVP